MTSSAPPSNVPTPEGLQPHDYVMSASPPPDLSTTTATYRKRSTASQENTDASHLDDIDALATSSPFMDWLEAQMGSYDAKRRSSEQLWVAESGLIKKTATSQKPGKSIDA